jgi:proline dehydrogenase
VSLVDSAIVRLLPAVPRPVVRKISERYIAGEELDDALRLVRRLNDQGKLATIDVLGEEIASAGRGRARSQRRTGRRSRRSSGTARLERQRQADRARAEARLRPLPLQSPGRRQARRERDNFVRIDMEDSSTTDDTLRAYRELRDAGHGTSASSCRHG